MTITKRGNIYEVRCRYQGKALRRRFKEKWDAYDFESLVVKGTPPEEAALKVKGIQVTKPNILPTLKEFVEKSFLPGLADGRATTTENPAQRGTVHRAGNFLAPALALIGDKGIDKLSYQDYRELKWHLVNAPLNNGKPYAAGVANKTLSLLKQCLNFAVREEILPSNPWLGARGITVRREDKPHWRPEECERFLKVVREKREDHFIFFLLALQGGLRRAELFGLRKMDVDLSEKVLRVRRQWDCDAYEFPEDGVRKLAFKSTLKNGEPSKTIPLTDSTCAILEKYVKTLIRPDTPLYSFSFSEMKNPRLHLITPYAKLAGVDAHKMHATRDSFIGNMKRAGVSDFHIAKLAGCRIKNLERYGDLDLADVRLAVNSVGFSVFE